MGERFTFLLTVACVLVNGARGCKVRGRGLPALLLLLAVAACAAAAAGLLLELLQARLSDLLEVGVGHGVVWSFGVLFVVGCRVVAARALQKWWDAMRGRERELGGPHVGGAGTYLLHMGFDVTITIYGKRVDGM